jgi:hypothetical protein
MTFELQHGIHFIEEINPGIAELQRSPGIGKNPPFFR